ncbi:MAG: hypothetical protein WA993_01930 [Candidatus Binatus sp.]
MREDKLIPAFAAGEVPKSRSLAGAFGAFVVYQALSILFYGRGMIFRLAEVHAGNRRDPQIFIWCFQWWPHAIAQRLDAFHPRIIWAPEGVDLAWVTSVPLPSLLAAPLTARYGAVVSYNLATLLMPALAALAAFVLIRRIAGSTWPAMLGGYLFGFSPYMIGHQAAGHSVLTAAFLAPVVVYLALLRLDDKIARPWFVITLAIALTCQFLISMEIFATIVMFGAAALIVAWFTIPAISARIRDVAILSAMALAASIVVLTPYLYRVVVASGLSSHPLWNTTPFSTDLLEMFIPTSTLMLGHLAPLHAISSRYSHNVIENGAYIGIPLVVIVVLYLKSRWKRPEARFMAIMLAMLYVASYGARLHVAGYVLFGMPWKLLTRVPLINSAFPVRLTLYIYLIVALIASLWIAELRASAAAKAAIVAAVVLFMLPDLNAGRFVYELDTPDFFRSGAYRNYLTQGETILALPFGEMGSAMYWQAAAKMNFGIAEGHFGPTPTSFLAWPIVGAFLDGGEIPDAPAQLNAFMATHGVTAVVFRQQDPSAAQWRAMLESGGAKLQAIDDVMLARPDPATLERLRGASAVEMECRLDDARFAALLDAADRYLADGRPPAELSPFRAQQLGLLPPGWVRNDDGAYSSEGLWLAPENKGRVSVGVRASYACVQRLIAGYGAGAAPTYFPYPRPLESHPKGDLFQRKLVMVFTREALAHAAAGARVGLGSP